MVSSTGWHHRVRGAALATLGLLLLLPGARHAMRMQGQIETLTYAAKPDFAAERATAERMPGDYPVQLALATQRLSQAMSEAALDAGPEAPSRERNRRLVTLTQRFPNNPSAYANLLRYMTLRSIRLSRDDYAVGHLLTLTPSGLPHYPAPPSPEALAIFETAAQKGAQLDPDNAYFPMMRAVGLFAAYRDRDALAALQTAGRCSCWKEYFQDDLEGQDRLQNATYGDRGLLQRVNSVSAITSPQYEGIQSTARIAAYLAGERERIGRTSEGIAIRHAVMRCGGLMRAQGEMGWTSRVGIRITADATVDPGGLWNSKRTDLNYRQRVQEDRDRYTAYLARIGLDREVSCAKTEFAATDTVQAISVEANDHPAVDLQQFELFGGAWLTNTVLLVGASILLGLGSAAHLAERIRSQKARMIWRACYVLLIGGIGVWQWRAAWIAITPLESVSFFGVCSDCPGAIARYNEAQILIFGLSLLFPALVVGLIGILTLSERVPLVTGLERGLRGLALPIGWGMLLLYGGSLLPTVSLDTANQARVARYAGNEPRSFAQQNHKVWPGDPEP